MSKNTCRNCTHAAFEPSWALSGLWCQKAIDDGDASVSFDVDWGYDYTSYRIVCEQVSEECSCDDFERRAW